MLSIREAQASDAAAATEVVRCSITFLCSADHRGDSNTLASWLTNKTPDEFCTWLTRSDNYCVVAIHDQQIVGVGLLHRSGEVRLCYLAPGTQRRGFGSQIHAALERKAQLWGLRELQLDSTAEARSFYEALGYRPAGTAKAGFGALRCYPYKKATAA